MGKYLHKISTHNIVCTFYKDQIYNKWKKNIWYYNNQIDL